MKFLLAIFLSSLLSATLIAQEPDPFEGGDDTAVDGTEAPVDGVDAVAGDPNAPPPAPVAPPTPDVAGDSMVFHQDLKQFEFDVTVNALKTVNEKFTAPAFARSKKARGAINPPILLPSQVEARIQEEVDRREQVEFPDSRYDEIKKEAEAEYAMYKVGDRVTISVKPRGDKYFPMTGDLVFVTSNRIKISNFPIAKEDIAKQYLPLLYRVEHEKAVQKFVSRKTRIFNDQRAAYGEEQRKQLTKRMWIDAGFYPKTEKDWIPLHTAFTSMYEKVRGKEYVESFKAGREQIYLDNGWVFDPTLSRWLSPDEQLPPEPDPVAASDTEATGENDEPAGVGSIFDQVKNLINNEAGDNKTSEGGEEDIFADDPKEPEAKKPEDGADKPAPAPGDDNDDLFGE